jgi:1-acyl-sn-glycerol-3-phosphate acyltransferase
MPAALAMPRTLSVLGRARIILRVLGMFAWLIVCVPLYYLFRLFTRHNPVPRWFLTGINLLSGVTLRVHGEKVHRGAFLLVNHVSWIDIPALAAITGTAFVGHDGLASMPLLKWLCAMNDTVFVARYERASIAAQVEAVRTALSDTGSLAIFPEGTTSDGTGLLAFKSSLLSALEPLPPGIAVQPVLLDYGHEAGSSPGAARCGSTCISWPS